MQQVRVILDEMVDLWISECFRYLRQMFFIQCFVFDTHYCFHSCLTCVPVSIVFNDGIWQRPLVAALEGLSEIDEACLAQMVVLRARFTVFCSL